MCTEYTWQCLTNMLTTPAHTEMDFSCVCGLAAAASAPFLFPCRTPQDYCHWLLINAKLERSNMVGLRFTCKKSMAKSRDWFCAHFDASIHPSIFGAAYPVCTTSTSCIFARNLLLIGLEILFLELWIISCVLTACSANRAASSWANSVLTKLNCAKLLSSMHIIIQKHTTGFVTSTGDDVAGVKYWACVNTFATVILQSSVSGETALDFSPSERSLVKPHTCAIVRALRQAACEFCVFICDCVCDPKASART